ncbi:DUF2975 domain-containing protein [Metabacillus arenae]|uniref:DUF2975 domain-containing protein n=1 Tax=Metabacillus arenae TaxID=2771434 RepID=A0A926NJY7_9BACI|nr:DUF2975 domain-containing protein [Metabacillus arenae]MBD1381338.1 DUF2975 domain-containing protein [Metabacillus arenae]
MKRGSTLFLKIAVFLIGTPVLALCIFGLPWLAKEAAEMSSLNWAYLLYGVLIIMSVSAIPFFVALYQAFRLLGYIDKNNAFSELSVRALKNIKKCAITISSLYVVGMPLFYIIAELDDAPGTILIGMVIIFASMVIAVFAAVLQKLLEDAIKIKSENDLTV